MSIKREPPKEPPKESPKSHKKARPIDDTPARLLIQACVDGSITPDEQHKLERVIYIGKDTSQELVDHIKAQSDQGHPIYQVLHALTIFDSNHTTENMIDLFRRSHAQGCAYGTYWYAWSFIYMQRQQEKTGVQLIQKALEYRADPRLLYELGYCYLHGYGVNQDTDKALDSFMRAANMRYGCAARLLCTIFQRDLYKSRNLAKAAHWAWRAAGFGCDSFDLASELKAIQEKDAQAVIPYGIWKPRKDIHRWVSDQIHREMVLCLLVCNRFGILRDIVVYCVLPFICS